MVTTAKPARSRKRGTGRCYVAIDVSTPRSTVFAVLTLPDRVPQVPRLTSHPVARDAR